MLTTRIYSDWELVRSAGVSPAAVAASRAATRAGGGTPPGQPAVRLETPC